MKRIQGWFTAPGRWWRRLDETSRQILLVLMGVALVFSVPAALVSGDWSGLFLNLGTELAGGAVTFVLLDQILGTSRRKKELISQMGSRVNEEAIRAVEELKRRGWLQDGSLRGAYLGHANLQDAQLQEANLQGANFPHANLQGADLWAANLQEAGFLMANMQGADLIQADLQKAVPAGANLQGAHLWTANLREANLREANLQGAILQSANLQGTVLHHVNLQGARLGGAELDAETVLPDGTRYDPDLGLEQLLRFIDPEHPDFWRPEPGSAMWYPAKKDDDKDA